MKREESRTIISKQASRLCQARRKRIRTPFCASRFWWNTSHPLDFPCCDSSEIIVASIWISWIHHVYAWKEWLSSSKTIARNWTEALLKSRDRESTHVHQGKISQTNVLHSLLFGELSFPCYPNPVSIQYFVKWNFSHRNFWTFSEFASFAGSEAQDCFIRPRSMLLESFPTRL